MADPTKPTPGADADDDTGTGTDQAAGDNDGDEAGAKGDGDVMVLLTMHADGSFTVETEADGDEAQGQTEPDTHPQKAKSLVEALHIARSIFETHDQAHEGGADAQMLAGYNAVRGSGMGGMPGAGAAG